ncbi:hypothetical protein J2754_002816 [Halarchaeum solikamskense]|nr:hypothetical protein [Halarchaeum solikamskense]MBP2252470.1 hypothetical protein [Halarchaeum solikamskense]
MSTTTDAVHREQNTAPGPLPDRLFGQMPDWNYMLWPKSTQVIMSSLFLALGLIVSLQVAERLDTIMFGGVAPIWGTILFTPWLIAAGIFYGLTGGLIVANINPIVSNLTASSPLAPLFFPANTLYAVTIALFAWYFKTPGEGLRFREVFVANAIAGLLNVVPYILYQTIVLKLPLRVSLGIETIQFVAFILSLGIAYPFCKKLLEAGVVQVR